MNKIVDSIIALLESHVKTQRGFKKVYWGDPIQIPSSNLPCITVSPSETSVSVSDSGRDEDVYGVSIGVIIDGRDFVGGSDKKTEAFEDLILKMEERNDDMTVQDDTILSVVNSLEDDTKIFSVKNISINYGFKQRVEGEFTIEGVCTFTLNSNPYNR